MSFLSEIGRNMLQLRTALELTQEEAAFRSGLSPNCWRSIERGHGNPTIDTLMAIAQTLHVPLYILLILNWTDHEILFAVHAAPRITALTQETFPIRAQIVWLRAIRDWTQKELADISNVCPSRLRDIEHGCANVTIRTLERISEAFRVPLLEFFLPGKSDEEILKEVSQARIVIGKVSA